MLNLSHKGEEDLAHDRTVTVRKSKCQNDLLVFIWFSGTETLETTVITVIAACRPSTGFKGNAAILLYYVCPVDLF